ncbi:MAG: GGDEF domain-containing protein [Zetaproteobacteria bacterium]|nr:GGDEF domain-containing protein [Pseudobdellovibrionaceae bacterium]
MSDDKTIIADPSGISGFTGTKKSTNACLIQYSGTNLGKRFTLEKVEMIVGRSPQATIVINEQSVSRQHAKCCLNNNQVEIEDLGSSNGTFVNDQRISSRHALKNGDILRLGAVLFKFFTHDSNENLFHDKIYRMANIDFGTQTFNKKYLLEALATEYKIARTYTRPLSTIYFDLDHFKKVNDTYGHSAGDFILKEISVLVKGIIRKDDIFCRFGGEEFVILLPNTGSNKSFELAERIRKAVEAHNFVFENKTIDQKVSMGVSELTAEMKLPKELLDSADQKLYQSKQTGRNKVTM